MLTMSVTLLLMVTGFFALVVYPITVSGAEHVIEEYSRVISASSPDYEAAMAITKRLGVQIRYEGPGGAWETAAGLPTIAQVQSSGAGSFGHRYHVEPGGNGGTYLLVWRFNERVRGAHVKLLWLLLFLMMGVVFTAYLFQKRLLRPVRSLDSGVQQLSAGHLDIVLPVTTHDELGALTNAFNKMVGRVKQMIQARDQLLLDVSHELRSPITRMKVALALLPEDENRTGMAADLTEMEIMVTELLELERLRDGRGIKRVRQDLMKILREVARSFDQRPPGIRLASIPQQMPLEIDGDKIRTVLRNLFENAIKYSLPNSSAVEVSAVQSDSSAVIRVRDDGPGIPQADLSNLFEPFFRVDRSRSRKTGGYGLGLSICKRIMEAHGGRIEVENNPGRGASFILTLPLNDAAQQVL